MSAVTGDLRALGEDLWVAQFPFRIVGAELGKAVTVMRLPSGELVVHSGAPWSAADVAAIQALGPVRWVMEATRLHDTFARELRAEFPEAEFLWPARFPVAAEDLAPGRELGAVPAEWAGEIEVEPLGGIPATQEVAVYHRRSRTLVLADLVFNLRVGPGERVPFFVRWVSGLRTFPGTSRLLRLSVKDRAALRQSLARVLAWDFERVVVGHGEIIAGDAKRTLEQALAWANG
ncbi:DUF4336 domain-containing protein [Actomonas aquatica]|uniref:DUF4336 domain-containing protein n=1 Tax=Actomonas aquatica TaxID=2866162 RepID=A0ABZ1CDY2_9BACT|nr:DUF4336 domain-containing protein [Opitutus sp. WL0086]WRQ89893.1 DUF4336 domain-containing protein [Opitutus sp. WL0086]